MFSKQTCIYLIHSTQSVKKFGYLRKRRHNELLSPPLCPKVTKYVSPQLTQPLVVVYLVQCFPKYGSKPKQGWLMVKKARVEAEPEEGPWAKRGPQVWLSAFVTAYRDTKDEVTKNWFHTFPFSIFTFIYCNTS